MKNKPLDMVCFSSIELKDPILEHKSVHSAVVLKKINNERNEFILRLKYQNKTKEDHLPIYRLAFVMPLLNYGLFTKKIKMKFPVSKTDLQLIKKLNVIFSKDIFINKILRRRANYILPKYLPDETQVKPNDAQPKASIQPEAAYEDKNLATDTNSNNCGVLSSGGKESLLTYGLLKEIGCNVFPFYINESGGHWRTAIPAYHYHKNHDLNTQRVWTNVDRFYTFMLDNLKIIRTDHRKIWADTYPIRLCIFPYYVFALLPLYIDHKIGNLLIGSEFDDIRSPPQYLGIPHYYGIYDQHQDHDIEMNIWYAHRIPGMVQWSAVRTISGLIVERILVKRYPQLAQNQRSCHSCHFEKKDIIPCGTCSKCHGVLLFLHANKADPAVMKFTEKDITSFSTTINPATLRLDEDEKNHCFYLIGKKEVIPNSQPVEHVEKIHLNKKTIDINLIPNHLRSNLLKIIEKYTQGYCQLQNEKWMPIEKTQVII